MDFDIVSRSSRLEREQEQRREAARRKREKEIIAQRVRENEEQKAKEAAIQKRAAQEAFEELQRLKEAEEYELTNGIQFSLRLSPYLLEESDDDKIILPQSAIAALDQQGALGSGVCLFRLSVDGMSESDGKVTHSGVREFTAEEGKVGLPRKVIDSLLLTRDIKDIHVFVKYVRMSKVSFVKFQPKAHHFSNVGPVKAVLEENLRSHSALSLGDVVTVWYRGKPHVLKVIEMKPESFGSLLDTDVEVDIDVSEEYVSHTAEQRNITGNIGKISTVSASIPAISDSNATSAIKDSDLKIPEEPSANAPGTIACRVRTASGKTLTRRFFHNQPFSHLFLYILSQGEASSIGGTTMQLSTRFPARRMCFDSFVVSEQTFEELGLVGSQELFIISYV